MERRHFHLGDILSITTGRLVSPRLIEGVYDILGYMTRDTLWTHQLPRASGECRPWLLRWHPQLAEVDASIVNSENWEQWLACQVTLFGRTLPVQRIPADDHERKHPWDELVAMRGTDEGIIPVALSH